MPWPVVDTRPPRRIPTHMVSFLGPRRLSIQFDPDVNQFMHFRNATVQALISYMSCLATNQALVEVTSFAPQNPGHEIYQWFDI
jgi:lycopene beta-cyclase